MLKRALHRAGGIRTIPPGFIRGLDFGPLGDDVEGRLLEEEEEVHVEPIYRPMLELSSKGKTSAVLVSPAVSELHPRKLTDSTTYSEWKAARCSAQATTRFIYRGAPSYEGERKRRYTPLCRDLLTGDSSL